MVNFHLGLNKNGFYLPITVKLAKARGQDCLSPRGVGKQAYEH